MLFETNIVAHSRERHSVDSRCEEYYCDSIWEGGVGKSTTTVNLALSLHSKGQGRILDGDIYGPSIPLIGSGWEA